MLAMSKSILLHFASSSSPLHPYGLRPILHAIIADSMDLLPTLNVVRIVSVHLSNLMNFHAKLPFCPNDLSYPLPIASITTTTHHRKQALAHTNPLK
jgi:hypothetical protein